ncbi:uncharacterized protein LOC119195049 isoform X2 [Pungitius pungitius]
MCSWADARHSANKVSQHLKSGRANDDVCLDETVNEKFREFHRDVTEESGARFNQQQQQHAWAVIETREEVVMHGPYYPNYNKGEHSEDVVIEQTQELLEARSASEDTTVYVFTVNSPCLARDAGADAGACMLNLVHKAHEWWSGYGVKTRVGYLRCWGFKGTKEQLFRGVDRGQVDCVDQSEDHAGYVRAAEKAGMNPLSEGVFAAVKHTLLTSAAFAPRHIAQGRDWKSYFTNMQSIFESVPEEEKEICTREANAVMEAARVLLSERGDSFEEYLERGCAFALDYTFSSQLSASLQAQIRLRFQQCWKEMVKDKYAEFIREKLTEDFNQRTVQLFIKDIAMFTKEYLEIGRIQISEEAPQVDLEVE